MLGNFSFGDYFKADAVQFAYQLLVKDYAIDPKRLVYTVHHSDDEARLLWKKVAGVGDDRVLGLGDKDNFWAMGEVGPCGPCSEIHYHQGDDVPCPEAASGRACLGPACDCDRWIEIWNLVFMQFEQLPDRTRRPLPKPSVDTGMGLERLCAVLGGFRSNYETDLLRPLIARSREADGKELRAVGLFRRLGRGFHARHCGPCARRRVPHRRRRVSRKDRSRIRPAPDHEARHLPRLVAGTAQRQPFPQARVHGRRHDGGRLPRTARSPRRHRGHHARGRKQLPRRR